MNDQLAWLERLAAARPSGTAQLTAEILDRAGPAPVPSGAGGDVRTASFVALHVVPLLAEDSAHRAALRADRYRLQGALAAAADADAESAFWLRVRDLACTWSRDALAQDRAWRRCCPAHLTPA